jgi:uncharacterized protein YaaN involved in tellurite resistance
MKKLTFKEWCESEGFEEIRTGTNDLVNVEYLEKAFNANKEYIKKLEREIHGLKEECYY